MTRNRNLVYFFLLILPAGALLLPGSAQAATKTKKALPRCNKGFCVAKVTITPGADERNFDNPTTRCLTPEMNKLHEQALEQMKADVKKYGEGKAEQVVAYQDKLDVLWSAMHEPYCGYGSQGMKAVKHSWDKTVRNVRNSFLEEVGVK